MIIFISGGARSGKSRIAERIAVSIFNKKKESDQKGYLYYIATAKRSDLEMEERIQLHQQSRLKEWQTVEASADLSSVLVNFKKNDVILIDCLTIWLSNVMFELKYNTQTIEDTVYSWSSLAKEKQFQLIFVSNDVNEGIPHLDEDVLTYMYTLQRIHQNIVERAEVVVQVIAGIPVYWKGGT